jgi:NhaP-type Na+/H+ or K+/H+ antiporter
MFHDIHITAETFGNLGILAMVMGGMTIGAVTMIAREIGRQRIAQNLLRERLARHWATARLGPPAV